jgi:hypothetical protein
MDALISLLLQALVNFVATMCHLCYKLVEFAAFSPVSHSERRGVQREVSNYVMRMLFVSMMVGANMHELAVWNGWFAIVAVPTALTTLCAEKFNSVCFSPCSR